MTDDEFIPGIALSRIMYEQSVRPLLDEAHPGLPYTAALVGPGSEVLGFDTARSTDHDWGPRLLLFLTPEDVRAHGSEIGRLLSERLPKQIRGHSTHFKLVHGPIGEMELTDGPVNHRVVVRDVSSWLTAQLGVDASTADPESSDWLTMPQQTLAEITGGEVFHDGLGTLTAARKRLAWYPDQIWRYLLACQWQRISQREAFVGRCAEAGDPLGSALVTAHLVSDLMRVCLLLERTYAPYDKWLGSTFGRLAVAGELMPSFQGALAATQYRPRAQHLCDAYEIVATLHNRSGLTPPLSTACRRYYNRPFRVLFAERFADAMMETITDSQLRARPRIGGVDQWTDNTDFLGLLKLRQAAVA